MAAKRVLIMGVGNLLLGDEGFGVHALRYLEDNYRWPANARLVDGGTLGLMLMAELLECDLAVILDIAKGGSEPGTFYRLDNEDMAKSLSLAQCAHQTSIEDVLISCDLAGSRPEAVVFAMEPYDYASASARLTLEAADRLPDFCRKVVEELKVMGIGVQEKSHPQ